MLQLATPNLAGNHKGYIAPSVPITYVGQRVEADHFETEFNEEVTETLTVTSQHILYYCTYYSVSFTCNVHCTY